MNNPINGMKWALTPLGSVTQWFGENPDLYESMGLRGHNGIDLFAPYGSHLFAVADGVICDSDTINEKGGYGLHVRILEDVGSGEYREWTYGHMSSINVVLGQKVVAGQYLGNVGNTGYVVSNSLQRGLWSSNPSVGTHYPGTHCHFGLREIFKSPTGWQYPGTDVRVHVHNYTNGFKGAIDPLPFFMPKHLKSTWIIARASQIQSKVLFQAGMIMKVIGL